MSSPSEKPTRRAKGTSRAEFLLTGIDPGSTDDDPAHRRLVCLIENGGKLVIWGRDGNTKHIDDVLVAGFPCLVACDWREPEPSAREKHGHTHWVDENAFMKVV